MSLGPHTGLGHKVKPAASPNDTPALPWAFSAEGLQTAWLFHPSDQTWMQLPVCGGEILRFDYADHSLAGCHLPNRELSIPYRIKV